MRRCWFTPLLWLVPAGACLAGPTPETLPDTQPLTLEGDLSAQMVAGIDRFLLREIDQSVAGRPKFWSRDFSSPENYTKSIEPNRERLRRIIGAVDGRVPFKALEYESGTNGPPMVAETDAFTGKVVKWPVFEGVSGEGLLLLPKGAVRARVVAIPDADQTPEQIAGLAPGLAPERQFARRLAENGCEVLAPVLINRQDTWSGSERLHRHTNQPHREWIYRQAYEMGRHIAGYEVQKVLAAVDFFELEGSPSGTAEPRAGTATPPGHPVPRIGVAGYGEGGLIAFYAAAIDPRIEAALVSGYFDSRQRVWEEPIYRNVWGLLREFGDAEVASLIAPRALIVEHSEAPRIDGPPHAEKGRAGAAPGKIVTPDYESVEREFERARQLLNAPARAKFDRLELISGAEGMTTGPGSDRALTALLNQLDVRAEQVKQPGPTPTDTRLKFDPDERQRRQVAELEEFTQQLLRESKAARDKFFWQKMTANSPGAWAAASEPFRRVFEDEVIGRLPSPTLPPNPRSRPLRLHTGADSTNRPASRWNGYEVVLDVYPDVFAWGDLLVPADMKPGERRPVVVCQHGLSAVPEDTINQDTNSPVFKYYKGFAARLADEGFVVFAPHNPFRDGGTFRPLQRKANPLKKTIFSIIVAQDERTLEWLSGLPFVDARRIGFYGLSYGGSAAMRVPAVLEGFALSICSANFNDWAAKNASVESPMSYLFGGEYEMPEFNLGNTFGYAEMAALIAPRPFMVERGRQDPVASDEWVAGEYAGVRSLYEQLGIADRTRIEFFDGAHTVNGVGTFEFLHHHLEWPGR